MKIGGREVGPGHPCWIVAESGLNQNGDLATALEMVHAAKAAGADAFKVQCFSADCQAVVGAASWQGEDQHAMFKRYEPPREAIQAIADECRHVGLIFFGTPDCLEHARWLVDAGAPCLKVGSDDLTHTPLIRDLAGFGLPLILSTGMADPSVDVERALTIVADVVRARGDHWPDFVMLLHCVALYPTPTERANLRRILNDDGEIPRHAVGYSDHTDGAAAAPLAVALGACLIEKHFTLGRSMPGPDHTFSADPVIFAEMVRRIREAEMLLGTGDSELSDAEKAMRPIARRSIVSLIDQPAGTLVHPSNLAYKRPGTGLMPHEQDRIIGKRLLRDVRKDEQILMGDVQGPE